MNSTKFAAIEIMNQQQLMRPTSSRFGNFLSSDKPASEENIHIKNMAAANQQNPFAGPMQNGYIPSNLPYLEQRASEQQQPLEHLAKINTNSKPPLSQRAMNSN